MTPFTFIMGLKKLVYFNKLLCEKWVVDYQTSQALYKNMKILQALIGTFGREGYFKTPFGFYTRL